MNRSIELTLWHNSTVLRPDPLSTDSHPVLQTPTVSAHSSKLRCVYYAYPSLTLQDHWLTWELKARHINFARILKCIFLRYKLSLGWCSRKLAMFLYFLHTRWHLTLKKIFSDAEMYVTAEPGHSVFHSWVHALKDLIYDCSYGPCRSLEIGELPVMLDSVHQCEVEQFKRRKNRSHLETHQYNLSLS